MSGLCINASVILLILSQVCKMAAKAITIAFPDFFCLFVCLFLGTGFHCIAQVGCKLAIHLPQVS
jgi:hypothetical protein